jgi:hypothetical protein
LHAVSNFDEFCPKTIGFFFGEFIFQKRGKLRQNILSSKYFSQKGENSPQKELKNQLV